MLCAACATPPRGQSPSLRAQGREGRRLGRGFSPAPTYRLPETDTKRAPGHCPGGVCLAIGKAGASERELFVGDTLFAGSIGRTDLPGSDHETLMRSIREVLLTFPDPTIVHSGHGPDTTIGQERRTNPFL